MIAIFLPLLIVSLSVDLSVAVDNDCIKKFDYNKWRGLEFSNCAETAEVTLKWKKEHVLWTEIHAYSNDLISFELTFNDQCTWFFVGKLGDNQYGLWRTPEGKVFMCTDVGDDCRLKINEKGKLMTYDFQDVGCGNTTVRNDIDDEWTWTKIRVVNFQLKYDLRFVVYNPEEGEAVEYVQQPTNIGVSAEISSFALFSALIVGIFLF